MLLLLLLFKNIDEVKPAVKNKTCMFSNLSSIIRADRNLNHILQRIVIHPQDVPISLNEVIDWLADEDTYELDVVNATLIDISSKLNWIMMRMEVGFASIERMISHLPLAIEIDSIKRDLALTIRKVKDLFDVALTASRNISQHNESELQNLTTTLTGKQVGDLQDSLSKLYHDIVLGSTENGKKNYLNLLNQHVTVIIAINIKN